MTRRDTTPHSPKCRQAHVHTYNNPVGGFVVMSFLPGFGHGDSDFVPDLVAAVSLVMQSVNRQQQSQGPMQHLALSKKSLATWKVPSPQSFGLVY